ncbi:MAG: hypothetical protein HY878_03875, partial [Deltaproteobacteria bacterium]|nr:hypothetical protein [Deltaproteobacteria bacterium]
VITKGEIDEVHGPAKEGEQKRSVINYEKTEKALGWRPKVGLEEGLQETVKYFRILLRNFFA